MTATELASSRRAFAVNFNEVITWNVAAQFAVKWNWPAEVILPLKLALRRRVNSGLEALPPETEVTLLTIRFDGTIEPRETLQIGEMKGKLFSVSPGNVIFSKIDVRNGAIGLAPSDVENMCVTSEFPIYDVNLEVADPKYIKLLFRTDAFKTLLNSMISGTSGRKRIQPSQLEEVRVPLPDRPAQQKIISYWEEGESVLAALNEKAFAVVRSLNKLLISKTENFQVAAQSKQFMATYGMSRQWDVKAGRAAAFIAANPTFVRLGDFTEECTETRKPWEQPEKEWPIYGVSNKDGVFLNGFQLGKDFNAPYKKIKKDWFFHNPTRANVGSLGIVPEVPDDALTSPEYQVWRMTGGFLPAFMSLLLRTEFFLAIVAFSRVGGVKQRMYYANLAEIRLPMLPLDAQRRIANQYSVLQDEILLARRDLVRRKKIVEQLILGTADKGD